MRFVTPVLKRVVYPVFSGAGYFGLMRRSGLAVVTYHGVRPGGFKPVHPAIDDSLVTGERFREQLCLLKKRYTVISPELVRGWWRGEAKLPPRAVLLTCDDGLLNNLTEMLPILQSEGLQCLFFVTGASAGSERRMLWYMALLLLLQRAPAGEFAVSSGGIEISGVLADSPQRQTTWWNAVKRLSQIGAGERDRFLKEIHAYFGLEDSGDEFLRSDSAVRQMGLLSKQELQALSDSGMTIGAHTVTHPVLSQLPPEHAQAEIAESRALLEAALGKKVWAFAYPFGDAGSVTPGVLKLAEEAGFDAAFMNIGGGLGVPLQRYALPRVHVTQHMNQAEFDAHVSGFYESMQRGFRRSA